MKRLVSLNDTKIVHAPDVEQVLSDALSIINIEVIKFHSQVKRGVSLSSEEGRLFNNYIKSLCELNKEARESRKQADLGGLNTIEMIRTLAESSDDPTMKAIAALLKAPETATKAE